MGAWGGETRVNQNTATSNAHGWIRRGEERSGVCAAGSATTFIEILAMTVLGVISASGLLRPIGKAVLTAISTASTTITVGVNNILTLFAGDTVDLVSTAGVQGTGTLADLDGTPASGESIDLYGRHVDGLAHSVTLSDPSGASEPLVVTVDVNPTTGVASIDVSLETDGGSALVSTLDEVIAAINADAGAWVFADLAAGATGSTVIVVGALDTEALAGGVEAGGTISAGLTIVSTDTAAGTMVVDGAVTAAVGDYLKTTDGSDVAVGIMLEGVTTLSHRPDGDTYETTAIVYSGAGIVDEDQVIGLNDLTKADLPAIVFR